MHVIEAPVRLSKHLAGLLILYGAASLLHFAHNAEFLTGYPNLPDWLSRSRIYVVWCLITALGVLGYVLYRRAHELAGLIVLGIYAAIGFDGLLHYGRAPIGAHTPAMNLSIWFEVVAAALLLGAVLILAARYAMRRLR